MSTGGKLAVGAAVIVGVTGYMAYVGASASWKYYLTVDECLADTAKFAGQRLRVSGQVAAASLRVDSQRSKARFALAGTEGKLPVECSGPLPDNLAEEIEVVVEGRLDPSGRLQGDKLLTRCASKYERGAAEARTARARTAPRGEVR
jgi:cytochrome c-type biogenesis protein CcmE